MPANKTALDAIFKDVYEDGISEAVNNRNPLRDIITTESSPFTGRQIIKAAHTSRNVSPMFVGEDSPFADAGRQGYVNMEVKQKKMMARIRMTYEVMQHSMSNEGAFISARESEMNYLADDLSLRDEYALTQDGRGVLARLDETTPSGNATVELDAPGGITGDAFGNRYVQPGMYVAAVSPSGTYRAASGTASSVRRVESCNSDGTDIVLDSSPESNWTNSDFLVQAANAGVNDIGGTSFERAWWGLMALVDDGTYRSNYYGVTRTAVPHSNAYVVPSAGALSENLLQTTVDVVDQKLNGVANLFLCHHSVRRQVISITDSRRRYYGEQVMDPDPGTKAFTQGNMTWGGLEIRVIRDFPLETIMLLDTAQCGLQEYVSESGKWVDEDGQVLIRVGAGGVESRDSYEAWYRIMKQNYMDCPAVCARLDGVTGDTVVVTRSLGTG